MDFEDIEDMICYNLSYGIDVETTLSHFDNIDEDTKKYFIKYFIDEDTKKYFIKLYKK